MKTKSDEDREVVDLFQEEMARYKNELLCPICKIQPKECILTRCLHIFCKDCIDERINVFVASILICRNERENVLVAFCLLVWMT